MKNYVSFVGIGLCLVFFAACRKKENPLIPPPPPAPSPSPTVNDFFPITPGNYWVYMHTEFDSSGNVVPQAWQNDSVVVKADTVIKGRYFRTLVEYNFAGSTTVGHKYYRDSADCVVDTTGKIVFSINRPGLIYHEILTPDTAAYENYYNNPVLTSITVPLGTYNCVDYRGEVFRRSENFSKVYYTHKYCSYRVGPVQKIALYVFGLNRINFDLVAYHVQ